MIYTNIYSPESVYTEGVLAVCLLRGWMRGPPPLYARSFRRAGFGLVDTHLRQSQLKLLHFPFATEKHNCFSIWLLNDLSGPLAASWVSLGAFWVPLGLSWVSPGCLLGVWAWLFLSWQAHHVRHGPQPDSSNSQMMFRLGQGLCETSSNCGDLRVYGSQKPTALRFAMPP